MTTITVNIEVNDRATMQFITVALNALAEVIGGTVYYGTYQDNGAAFVIKQPAKTTEH